MLAAKISGALADEWLYVEPVRVGGVPAGLGTPDLYVTVTKDEEPLLRADVYSFGPDCFTFEEAIIWRDNLIVGLGSYVHAISLADRSTKTIDLGYYFGHLYPTDEYLLIASGNRLFRLEPDRSVRWTSEILGADGVLVHESGPPVIRGEADDDPPGGWRPFAISAATGAA